MKTYEEFALAARACGVPEHCVDGVAAYCSQHRRVGSFLTAVFQNDFALAVRRADSQNIYNLRAYADFLLIHAPDECWGSRKKVDAWLQQKTEDKS